MAGGPDPAVAEVRVAVRRLLTEVRPAGVLVACSGGADSVALAAATAFEAPRLGVPAGLVTVDHGLQAGSAGRAAAVAELGRRPGLGRGSGPRSIAGMRPVEGPWLRPLLGVRRARTRVACAAEGLPVWDDPHNDDPRFTRARLRAEVLPLLEDVLAGGVTEALARTAELLREDLDALG